MAQVIVDSYEKTINEDGSSYTFIQIAESTLEADAEETSASLTQTLVMIDVSGSMGCYWEDLMTSWNETIAPILKGNVRLWVFGDEVYFLRNGVFLEESDYKDEFTNLTGAIYTISDEIKKSNEKFIRVVLITDGDHNAEGEAPESAIEKLSVPAGKVVEFYLLGIGYSFPVECSIAIRSHLHNGNSNIPSLFWSKVDDSDSFEYSNANKGIASDIAIEIFNISGYLKANTVCFKLNLHGFLAPGLDQCTTLYIGEYLCFARLFKDLSDDLKVFTENGENIELIVRKKELNVEFLMNNIFRQWNSLVIQEHRKKGKVNHLTFEVMQKMFDQFFAETSKVLEEVDLNSIQYRLNKKRIKFLEVEYKTLMNQSKKVIGLEEKFKSDVELAEGILKTTVKSKHDTKMLRMRGHATKDYVNDRKVFKEKFEKLKDEIMQLPEPSFDECCCVTTMSPIKDLQDPNFIDLLEQDKFTFMKTFTVTGLPIYSPTHSFSQINPWTWCIKNILKSPFAVVSQSTLEMSAEVETVESEENKEIYLQKDNEESKFNAIIPIYSEEVIKVLLPLLKTNIFAMMNTFCILKNPYIIDYNAHFAALGCAWFQTLTEYPTKSDRPEFIVNRIDKIVATANIYIGRKDISLYSNVLRNDSCQALMTESSKLYDEKSIKCESLIKPLFTLFLSQAGEYEEQKIVHIFSLLIMEFIGRCLDIPDDSPYSKLFTLDLCTSEKQEQWMEKKEKECCSEILDRFIENKGVLHEKYFKPDDFLSELKNFARESATSSINDQEFVKIAVDLKKIEKLRNVGKAGNIIFNSLKTACNEFGVSESEIEVLFSYERIFAMVYHCLQYRASKERLSNEIVSHELAMEAVQKKIKSEISLKFKKSLLKKVLENALKKWKIGFLSVHEREFVQPMSSEEILDIAAKLGRRVSQDDFEKVYKYNPKTGLLRNACMVRGCSFYLVPNRTFNQHISMERTEGFFHQLHQISLQVTKDNGNEDDVIESITSGDGYESRNGLKVPPIPSKERLSSAKDSIRKLIQDYGFLLKESKIEA